MNEQQIQAYLDRIGCPMPEEVSEEALRKLTRAHLETVPFENLQVIEEGVQPSLAAEDLYRKVVENRRGGWCFELNKIYYLLLQGLGYECYPVPVRVLMGRPEPCPFSHRGTVVKLNGQRWYVDVGFGGLGPKGIINVDSEELQTIVGETFRVTWEGENCVIIRVEPDKEIRMLSFWDKEWLDCDFNYWNGFFASSPGSPFRIKRICYICTPTGWISMVQMGVTIFSNGVTSSFELAGEEEQHAFIKEKFKLLIPQWVS